MEEIIDEPIYDDRVRATIKALGDNIDKDELAQSFGLKHFKSLDMYMRRRFFKFQDGNYVPENTSIEKLEKKEEDNLPLKVQKILESFDEENADPRSISKKFHFNSVDELGNYLENNNIYWNPRENKYELKLSIRSDEEIKSPTSEIKSPNNDVENISGEELEVNSSHIARVRSSQTNVDTTEMAEYVDILELLKRNKNKLKRLIDNVDDNNGRLPNYAVPGINTTKTFSISSMLSNLIEEYSQAKGISQKDMLQISMVEFLMNHGYKEEMQILLNRK